MPGKHHRYKVMVKSEENPKAILYVKGKRFEDAEIITEKLNRFESLHAWVQDEGETSCQKGAFS